MSDDEKCETCGRDLASHNLKEALDCICTGAPLANGETWDAGTSQVVANRIIDKLADSDTERDA